MGNASPNTAKIRTKRQLCSWSHLFIVLGLIVVVLVTVKSWPFGTKDLASQKDAALSSTDSLVAEKKEQSAEEEEVPGLNLISSGVIHVEDDNRIAYYHCDGPGREGEATLVMLHGMRFTKQDWKTSGILKDLCTRRIIKKLSVFAVDLDVKSDFKDLMKFLDLSTKKGKMSKPVVLMTPSASGRTMSTWADSAAVEGTLKQYISKWIAVAPVSFLSTPEHDVRNLNELALPILAIYGNEDKPGKDVSERLHVLANARVVELEGGHPVYLDRPKEFVDYVVEFIESD